MRYVLSPKPDQSFEFETHIEIPLTDGSLFDLTVETTDRTQILLVICAKGFVVDINYFILCLLQGVKGDTTLDGFCPQFIVKLF